MPRYAYKAGLGFDDNDITFPIERMMGGRHAIVFHTFPRVLPKFLGPLGMMMKSCTTQRLASMYVVDFRQMNGRGGYARHLDPTIDLTRVYQACERRSLLDTFWGVMLDKPPTPSDEHILRGSGYTLPRDIERQYSEMVQNKSQSKHSNIMIDRSACLYASKQPLQLYFSDVVAYVYIHIFHTPFPMELRRCAGDGQELRQCTTHILAKGQGQSLPLTRYVAIRITNASTAPCSQSREDIVFGLSVVHAVQ
jgi:hypothetical protein